MTGQFLPAEEPSANQSRDDAAETLWSREDRFRLLVESVKDYSLVLLDPEGRVASWNAGAQRLLGYEEAEILGQHFSRFFTPEDIQSGLPERELERARDEGRAENDHWHVRKDGTRFWASGITTPIWDTTLRGYASVLRDLTEQKLAQDALRQSEERYRTLAAELEEMNRRRDQFLAMLSHELRNPLAPILTALEVMRQDSLDNPIQQQTRNIIERQARQMARLVDDLLETSRLTAGKLQLRKELLELRVILERAVEAARPIIDGHQHELAVCFPDEPIWLRADPTRLEQVFLNLLNNAAKYMQDGGLIRLSVERHGDEALVTIRDTGIGIPAGMLNGIFEMFRQVDHSLEQSHGGLGIGLTLVKHLTEMHGGTVVVRSEGPGQGSEFTVRLPVWVEPVQPPPPRNENAAVPRGLRILVVDDSKDAATMLSLILKIAGNEVRTAHDGLEALELAANLRPHVVLLDLGMPRLNGYEAARRIREQPWGKDVVLVALTGWGQAEDKQRTREAGFNHHLVKPVEPATLQRLLADCQATNCQVTNRQATNGEV